jgi:hypothetical protein
MPPLPLSQEFRRGDVIYLTVCLFESVWLQLVGLSCIAIEGLFFLFVGYTVTELDLLANDVRRLGDKPLLADVVRRHQRIIA